MDTKKLFRFLSVIFICVLFVILTAALLGQRFYGNYQPREIQVAIQRMHTMKYREYFHS